MRPLNKWKHPEAFLRAALLSPHSLCPALFCAVCPQKCQLWSPLAQPFKPMSSGAPQIQQLTIDGFIVCLCSSFWCWLFLYRSSPGSSKEGQGAESPAIPAGLQAPQFPAPEELSLVPWPVSLLKTKPWLLQIHSKPSPRPSLPWHYSAWGFSITK